MLSNRKGFFLRLCVPQVVTLFEFPQPVGAAPPKISIVLPRLQDPHIFDGALCHDFLAQELQYANFENVLLAVHAHFRSATLASEEGRSGYSEEEIKQGFLHIQVCHYGTPFPHPSQARGGAVSLA